MSNLRKLEGGRAAYAFASAKEGIKIPEYESWAKKMPMLIQANGLGAGLAFLKSKAKDNNVYQLLYKQSKAWLIHSDCFLKSILGFSDNCELIEEVIKLESPQYRAVTLELIAFFNWVRRFASGLENEKSSKDAVKTT